MTDLIARRIAIFLMILCGWVLLFYYKASLAGWMVYDMLPFNKGEKLSSFLSFFITNGLKIFLLLIALVFLISLARTWLPAEKIKEKLASMPALKANVLAGGLGVLTPYCSCSAIPMFIGFLETGIPLGITFTFLIAAPLVNEVILVMLGGLFGWKSAMLYLLAGLTVAVVCGLIIDKLKLEKHLPVWLLDFRSRRQAKIEDMSLEARITGALTSLKEILSRTWIYIIAGVFVGAAIHGYVPGDLLQKIAGNNKWYTMPLVVLTGIPLYSCPVAVAPVAFALTSKGVPIGIALAFVMAVSGLSLPEFLMLRKVLSFRLLLIFACTVFLGILFAGYFMNWAL